MDLDTFTDVDGTGIRNLSVLVTDETVVGESTTTINLLQESDAERIIRAQVHGEPFIRIGKVDLVLVVAVFLQRRSNEEIIAD